MSIVHLRESNLHPRDGHCEVLLPYTVLVIASLFLLGEKKGAGAETVLESCGQKGVVFLLSYIALCVSFQFYRS